MPGFIMEKEKEEDGKDKEAKVEELVSPQRSILEFFTSPNKVKEKPKNLLSYFGKTSDKQDIKKNGLQKDIQSKSTNKIDNISNGLNSSINEFDVNDTSKTKVKKEKKKGTKKSLMLEAKVKDGVSENDKEANDKQKNKTDTKVKDMVTENEKELKKEKKKGTKKSLMLEAKVKDMVSENGTESYDKADVREDKTEKTKKQKLKNEDKNKKSTSKEGKNEKEKECEGKSENLTVNGTSENTGINYLDFLKTLDTSSADADPTVESNCNKTEEKQVNDSNGEEMAQEKDTTEECVKQENDNSCENDSENKVNFPSITSFFTKVSGSITNNSIKQKSPTTLTTKADVHSEPCNTPKENHSTLLKKCSPLVNDTKLNEIVILSSEVVTVNSPVNRLKGRKTVTASKSARKSLNMSLSEEGTKGDENESKEPSESKAVNDIENKEAKERKKAFLQSSNTPVTSQKNAQSTLSFVKGGIQKSSKASHTTRVRKSECEDIKCESPLSKSTPVKRGRGRPPGSTKEKIKSVTDESTIEKENVTVIVDESSNDKTTDRKSSLRKKYKVDMISIDTKNKTPIRMRLTRCNKSGSSTDESFATLKNKTNLKQTKAQKLLEKAKKTKAGKSPEQKKQIRKVIEKNSKMKGHKSKDVGKEKPTQKKEEAESNGRRRSARLSGILQKSLNDSQDDVMIIEDDEEDVGKKKKKPKGLSTPKKDRKPSTPRTPKQSKTPGRKDGTPKKPAGKLAPIFMSKKQGEKVEEQKKVVLDPEQERLRREFLMSGVPEALKKQTLAATAAAVMCDLPPFPDIKHIQQMQGIVGKSGIDVWNLSNVELKYSESKKDCPIDVPQKCWNKCLLEKEKINCDLTNLKKFKQHPKIEENLLDPLLREIQRISASYNKEKMYSLLKEKKEEQDAEMNADGEEQKENKISKDGTADEGKEEKKKSRRRRSLRLKKKDEVMEIIDLGSPENKEETSTENKQEIAIVVPWTDKYQPTHSSEIVGNSNNVKKLKTWLIEWKHKVDKEARKMKKVMMKESKNKPKEKEDDWWADDDSDFDMDEEDSEDEEDRLCNTVMLMGPTGIGKTTAVYALAQEIGFKVFEVNASSGRNGKRILSQLQEATQSHRVSQNKGEGGLPLSLTPGKTLSPKKKTEKNLPTSFANFFKKSNNTAPMDVDKPKNTKGSKKGKKRKRDIEDSDADKTPKKKKGKDQKGVKFNALIPTTSNQATISNQGLNLASTSLILFEDVDIVFEEDKGFWSAIQTFMYTTKIPIVLTTNDVTLSSKFDGRYEQYLFKTPSMKQTTVYLQLICLAEGIRTNSEEIMTLVKVLSGDIRRCLLALQYWVDSGGGTLQQNQKIISPSKLKPLPPVCEDTSSQHSFKKFTTIFDDNSKSKMDDDDDFVSIKPVVNKRKRPLISDDESSNSAQPFPPSLETKDKPEEKLQAITHLSCLNSSLGLSLGGSQGIISLLGDLVKGHNDDHIAIVTEACDQYRKLMYNIVYNTYIDLLPMPKSLHTSPPTIKSKVREKKTHLKRIKTFDLYDSEASNDGMLDEPVEDKVEEVVQEESQEEKVAIVKSLEELTEFYDNMSFIDSITVSSEKPDSSNSFISHSKRNYIDTTNSLEHIDKDILCSEIEVRTLYKLCLQQRQVQDTLKKQHIETLSIPSVCSQSQGALVNRASNSTNLVLKKASNNIISNLPLTVRCHQRSIVMDYIPTLREMCKAEKLREIAKAKRRFHHYFDNIGLNLKDTTLDVMYTSFQ